jgi:uncharacterized protein
MLIEFSVSNYRSFKEKATFSMVAANVVAKNKELDETNVFAVDGDLRLLKSAAIYGANASGKSNLAQALEFMKWFMINSSKETQSTDKITVEPFPLSVETEGEPSCFELIFLMEGRRYRYGFEANRDRIVSEWLYYVPKSRETRLFERENDAIKITKTYKAEGLQPRTRSNALFLSVCAQFNVEIAEQILDWVSNKLKIISGLKDRNYFNYTLGCLTRNENREEILRFVKQLDLGISDIQVENKTIVVDKSDRVIVTADRPSILTMHRKFDQDGKYQALEEFDLTREESEGTRKVFALSGLLVSALKNSEVLVVDEFDARLHPLISLAIIGLFNSNDTNFNHAQLVFMTHDTTLLSNQIFRRDQIWFMEKDRYGATTLYSLAEYKVRNDASFESDYIKGRYGAIPYIGDLTHLVDIHG